jgi:hypothetical protein
LLLSYNVSGLRTIAVALRSAVDADVELALLGDVSAQPALLGDALRLAPRTTIAGALRLGAEPGVSAAT